MLLVFFDKVRGYTAKALRASLEESIDEKAAFSDAHVERFSFSALFHL